MNRYLFNILFFFTAYFVIQSQSKVQAQTNRDTIASDTVSRLSDSMISSKQSVENTTPELKPPAELRKRTTELWVFIACCLTVFLAGINRRINEKRHDNSILGFLDTGLIGQATDRSFYEFNIHQLLGIIVHNQILALWACYFLKGTDYQLVNSTLQLFILLFFVISFIYMSKFFFQYLTLNILQINDLPVLLVKGTVGLGYFASLISLPLFMVLYYTQLPQWQPILVTLFVIIISGYLIFRLFKFIQLFAQFFGTSIFYNILYFCGLELIPLMVFIKLSMVFF